MDITPIPAFRDNYIWCLTAKNNPSCVVVDPGDAEPVFAYLQQHSLDLAAILITHHHWDHTGGIAKLLKSYSVPVYGPKHDNVAQLSHVLAENDEVSVPELGLNYRVLDIPGHTLGHIAFYDHESLFCGDTLFSAGCGRLFEGTAEQMWHSLQKMAQLPDTTKVYCAHEYTQANLEFALEVEPNNPDIAARLAQIQAVSLPSTILIEKSTNPFLRCHLDSVKHAAEDFTGRSLPRTIDVFAAIRSKKDIS